MPPVKNLSSLISRWSDHYFKLGFGKNMWHNECVFIKFCTLVWFESLNMIFFFFIQVEFYKTFHQIQEIVECCNIKGDLEACSPRKILKFIRLSTVKNFSQIAGWFGGRGVPTYRLWITDEAIIIDHLFFMLLVMLNIGNNSSWSLSLSHEI